MGTQLPDGGGITNLYSPRGELLTNYGSRTYPVAHTFDAQGRQTTMTTWTNFATRTGAATTTWNFDTNRGFLLSKVYADGRGTTNTYTGAGRLATRQWARGITTTYLTNSAGQTVAVIYSDGTTPNVTNTFDRQGRITEIATSATTLRRTYSESGLLLSETNAAGPLTGVRLDYAYDSLNRLTNVTMQPFNLVTIYAFDTASRLTNVSDGTYHATYSYLANSPLINQITFRSNSTTRMTTTKQYDLLNRLLSIQSSAGVSPVASFNYVYNDANQRTLRTDADGSAWRYEYDNLGQVTSGKRAWSDNVPVAGQQYEYAYDDIGNRLSTKEGGDASGAGLRPASYSANSLNQYTTREVPAAADILGIAHPSATVTVNDLSTYRKGEYFRSELAIGNQLSPIWTNVQVIASLTGTNQTNTGNLLHPKASETFTFDADGNQTSDSLWTNSWDGENRLISTENTTDVPTAGRAKETWTLDSQGRWIQRIISTWSGSSYTPQSTNRFVWDGRVLLAILEHTNGLVISFLRGLDLSDSVQGAGGAGGLLAVNIRTNGVHFVANDGNGNIVALVKADDGTLSGSYEYDPFARMVRLTGTAAKSNPLRFSTQFTDELTGSSKYLYRDYSVSVGRWLNRDPIEEMGGANLHTFVRNAPVSYTDPFGHDDPGCNLPDWLRPSGDCYLRCCAQHDECYFNNGCTAASWGLNAVQVGGRFLGPLGGICAFAAGLHPCTRCNNAVVLCFARCATGIDPPEGERWFCPNGPNAGRYYDNYLEIPPDCWKDGERPPPPP